MLYKHYLLTLAGGFTFAAYEYVIITSNKYLNQWYKSADLAPLERRVHEDVHVAAPLYDDIPVRVDLGHVPGTAERCIAQIAEFLGTELVLRQARDDDAAMVAAADSIEQQLELERRAKHDEKGKDSVSDYESEDDPDQYSDDDVPILSNTHKDQLTHVITNNDFKFLGKRVE